MSDGGVQVEDYICQACLAKRKSTSPRMAEGAHHLLTSSLSISVCACSLLLSRCPAELSCLRKYPSKSLADRPCFRPAAQQQPQQQVSGWWLGLRSMAPVRSD